MDAYIYQAALWCETCTAEIKGRVAPPAHYDPDNESSYDSDEYPKGPYSDGGGEADVPQHCDGCGAFLRNRLTDAGDAYVRGEVESLRLRKAQVREWLEVYDYLDIEIDLAIDSDVPIDGSETA